MSDQQSADKTRWGGVAFGLVLAAFAAFQQFKLPPVLPVMLEDYHYDLVLAGGFMSIYALVGLVVSMPLSRLIARVGPVGPLWGGLALFLLGNVISLAVPESGWVVLFGRGLEGLAFAVMALIGPASASANAARSTLPLVFALTAAWVPTGQMVAAVVALPTQDAGIWRPVWWLAIVGTLLLGVWLASMQRGRGIYLGAGSRAKSGRALTGEERLLLWVAGTGFLLFSGQYIGYMTWFPSYLVEALGFTPAEAIYAYLIPVALVAVFNVVSAWLLRRGMTPAGLLVVGFGLDAVGWLLPFADVDAFGLVLLFAYGIGAGLVPAGLFAMPTTIVGPGGPTIAAFGIMMTLRNFGVLVGPLLLAVLITPDGGWSVAAPVFCTVNIAALVMCLWLARRMRGRAT